MKAKNFLAMVTIVVGTSVAASGAHVDVGIAVGTAPPPPVVESVPVGVAPGPGYVWVNGYWDWVGGSWVWVPGRWVLPPQPHAFWVAPYYHPYGAGYHFHRGYWR
jgi:hypothetical protein